MSGSLKDAPAHTAWILAGATATGKSAVAQWIAERQGAAILSADAMLVYRGMDIGTAKPTVAQMGDVPYLGLDCTTPQETFSVGNWLTCAQQALAALTPPRPIIVVGGTGLYIRALLAGLDGTVADPDRRRHWQELFEREGLAGLWQALAHLQSDALLAPGDRDNPRRCIRALERAEAQAAAASESAADVQPLRKSLSGGWVKGCSPTIAALRLPREHLHARIERRIRAMFESGLVDEAVALRARRELSLTASQAIGYAEALAFADGTLSFEDAVAQIAARTRRLAKRQLTWFRHQLNVHWVDISDDMPVEAVAQRVLKVWSEHGPSPIHDTPAADTLLGD